MRLKAILTLLTTLALASGHPDQWKLDMQDAAQAGYQSWLLDNISELFGFNFNFGGRRRQGSPSLEKPDSAVEEAMCTADGCSRPTSFELAAEAQSKAIIKKKANTDPALRAPPYIRIPPLPPSLAPRRPAFCGAMSLAPCHPSSSMRPSARCTHGSTRWTVDKAAHRALSTTRPCHRSTLLHRTMLRTS